MGVENLAGTLYWDSNTNRQAKVHKKTAVGDPLLKVPPASRGNLQEGVINCCFFVSFGLAIGISRSSASCSQGFEALPALRRDNTS